MISSERLKQALMKSEAEADARRQYAQILDVHIERVLQLAASNGVIFRLEYSAYIPNYHQCIMHDRCLFLRRRSSGLVLKVQQGHGLGTGREKAWPIPLGTTDEEILECLTQAIQLKFRWYHQLGFLG